MCTNNVYIGFWECVEMKRTQVYLTEEQKAALDDIAKMRSISMAEVVREAVSEYLDGRTSETRFAVLDETFGAVPEWQDADSVEHVRNLRSGWDGRRRRVKECTSASMLIPWA
jgi:Arc/MetJ-type ribon-helix-helix transcriptional regulator